MPTRTAAPSNARKQPAAVLRAWAHEPRLTPWALALGTLLGFGLGWLAPALGPWAAVGLALLLAAGLGAVRGRVDWVSQSWPVPTALPPAPPPVELDPDRLIAMVALSGGRFRMGSGRVDRLARDDEHPRHPVSLSRSSLRARR
jgi:hypothetical protein